MDSLLSPTFRTRTQKFYYDNDPDKQDRSNGVRTEDGAASPPSARASSADSAAKSNSPRGKPSYFTFDHVPFTTYAGCGSGFLGKNVIW
jgi:hypothetical protein